MNSINWEAGTWQNPEGADPVAEVIIAGDWAPIRAFSDIITRGEGLLSVIDALLVLSFIATAGLVVAVAVFGLRQRRGVAE